MDSRDDTQRVSVYDFETQTFSTIPAAELAPGMVCVRIDGVEGDVWVDGAQLPLNSHQHPPFDEEIRDLLRQIQAALDEVYPMSLEGWEDGFRRDHSPEREIAYWLHLAQVYARLTAPDDPLGATFERRQDVFTILTRCGIAPRERVLTVTDLETLSREEAKRVVDAFFEAGEPAQGIVGHEDV